MIDFVDELEKAGNLLDSALDKYLDACFAIRDHCRQANSLIDIPRAVVGRISSMLPLIASCETKVSEAKLAISQARNCFPSLVPIHSLPSEILVRILHLVAGTYEKPWTCALRYRNVERNPATMPKYPDLLSHVCAHWRQIMIDTPVFWAHIDLVSMRSGRNGFLARASAYAARAAKLPLDIHFYAPGFYTSSSKWDIRDVINVLTTFAPRVKSLDLDIPAGGAGIGELILQCCVDNCIPETFTELILPDSDIYSIIPSSYDPNTFPKGLRARTDPEIIERLLLPVTALRLRGVHFAWTHPVYHGLVELYLVQPHIRITESELIGILSSSPRLQILHLDIPISDPLPEHSSVSPVHLEALEILNITPRESDELGSILGLLDPGSKPLRLTLMPRINNWLELVKDEIKSFLARSNVVRFHVTHIPQSSTSDSILRELLALLPHLQVLGLDNSKLDQSVSTFLNEPEPVPTHSNPLHVDALYLTRCKVDLEWLGDMLKRNVVGTAVFWKSTIVDQGRVRSDHELKAELADISLPFICVDEEEPNPIGYWDWPFSK